MFDQAQRQRTRLSTPHVITILLYVYIYISLAICITLMAIFIVQNCGGSTNKFTQKNAFQCQCQYIASLWPFRLYYIAYLGVL